MDIYILFLQDPGPRPFVTSALDAPLGVMDPFYLTTASDTDGGHQYFFPPSIRNSIDTCLDRLSRTRQRISLRLQRWSLRDYCPLQCASGRNIRRSSDNCNARPRGGEPSDCAEEYQRVTSDSPSGLDSFGGVPEPECNDPPCYKTALNKPRPTVEHRKALLDTQHRINASRPTPPSNADVGVDDVIDSLNNGSQSSQTLTVIVIDVAVHDNDRLPSYQAALD